MAAVHREVIAIAVPAHLAEVPVVFLAATAHFARRNTISSTTASMAAVHREVIAIAVPAYLAVVPVVVLAATGHSATHCSNAEVLRSTGYKIFNGTKFEKYFQFLLYKQYYSNNQNFY